MRKTWDNHQKIWKWIKSSHLNQEDQVYYTVKWPRTLEGKIHREAYQMINTIDQEEVFQMSEEGWAADQKNQELKVNLKTVENSYLILKINWIYLLTNRLISMIQVFLDLAIKASQIMNMRMKANSQENSFIKYNYKIYMRRSREFNIH